MERKPVRYWHLIRRVNAVWLLFPLIFTIAFGGVGVFELQRALRIEREATVIEGVVTAKWIDRVQRDRGEDLTYRLRYEFTPPERGTLITRTENVSEQRYRAEKVGDPITVTYAWSRPQTSSIDPRADRFAAVLFTFFGAIAAAGTVGMAVWLFARKASIIRALRWGEVREARVTALRQTNVRNGTVAQFVIDWVDASGAPGTSLMAPEAKLAAYPVGSVIVVYVDPKTGKGWWDVQI